MSYVLASYGLVAAALGVYVLHLSRELQRLSKIMVDNEGDRAV
jgi:hypothetical protein